MNKSLIVVMLSAGTVLLSQTPLQKDWVDPATGHRIVRLTGDAGGSTLYFHDNAFSPEGDTLMFNTPSGIAVVDVAKIGSAGLEPEIVGPTVRGGYFARRTREIYYGSAGGDRRPRSTSTRNGRATCSTRAASSTPTKRCRSSRMARPSTPTANTLARRCGPSCRNCNGCFPGKQNGRPHARSAVFRQERRRAGASRAESVAAIVCLHEPQERRACAKRDFSTAT